MPSAAVTDSLVHFATNAVGTLGLGGVFVLMLAESACIPIPSEATMLFAGFAVSQGRFSLFAIVAIGVLGNLIGSWIAFLFFGGNFPSPEITNRLFVLHVLFIPMGLAALIGLHVSMLWRQKHSQFPGPRQRETNVVGSPLWPTYAIKSFALMAATFGSWLTRSAICSRSARACGVRRSCGDWTSMYSGMDWLTGKWRSSAAYPIELGAEFVHGRPKATLSLADEARLAVDLIPDAHLLKTSKELVKLKGFWSIIGG